MAEKAFFAFTDSSVLTEELSAGARQHRKAEATGQAWQSDKKSTEKSGFDFWGDFVLTEGLGGAAGHRKAEAPG
ncbi:hypothetical protein [Metabacillus sp. SLBN-84]